MDPSHVTRSWSYSFTFLLGDFGTLERDQRRSTDTSRLSGMKRVILLQTNHQKEFNSLRTWEGSRFVRTRKHSDSQTQLHQRNALSTNAAASEERSQYTRSCIRGTLSGQTQLHQRNALSTHAAASEERSQYTRSCIRGTLSVRMHTLRITRRTHLLLISILLASFSRAGTTVLPLSRAFLKCAVCVLGEQKHCNKVVFIWRVCKKSVFAVQHAFHEV